ncbi:MAG: segregation and condensation protein A [Actinomycetales bacterium]
MATQPDLEVPGGVLTSRTSGAPFEVHLDVFEGPFDLLLGLISKHKLDITEVALAKVTDEFIGWIKAYRDVNGEDWDLAKASEFLVVAATLLDLKAARLLPSADEPDEDDLALIEARDLLFARLLQYRAFKGIAAVFEQRMADRARRMPRQVGLEPRLAGLLPELVFGITPEQVAALAGIAMTPRPEVGVGLDHLHAPAVSVREQAAIVVERLRHSGTVSFRSLVADSEIAVVVARFLALLELYREGAVAFDQVTALGELSIRWVGEDDREFGVGDEFDVGGSASNEEGRS